MAEGPPLRVLLIVTGSTLRAEEMDRPLGYYLKQRIEQSLADAIAAGRDGLEGYVVRVVADFRWIHDDPLQSSAHDLPRRAGRQRPGASMARGGPRLARLRRALLHPDGSRPGRTPRQRLGHGQRHHPDRRLRLHRPVPPAFPRPLRHHPTPTSPPPKATSKANPGPTSTTTRRRLTGRHQAGPMDPPSGRRTDPARARKPHPLPMPTSPASGKTGDFSQHEVTKSFLPFHNVLLRRLGDVAGGPSAGAERPAILRAVVEFRDRRQESRSCDPAVCGRSSLHGG